MLERCFPVNLAPPGICFYYLKALHVLLNTFQFFNSKSLSSLQRGFRFLIDFQFLAEFEDLFSKLIS